MGRQVALANLNVTLTIWHKRGYSNSINNRITHRAHVVTLWLSTSNVRSWWYRDVDDMPKHIHYDMTAKSELYTTTIKIKEFPRYVNSFLVPGECLVFTRWQQCQLFIRQDRTLDQLSDVRNCHISANTSRALSSVLWHCRSSVLTVPAFMPPAGQNATTECC